MGYLLSIAIGVLAAATVLLPIMLLLKYTAFRAWGGKKTLLVFMYVLYLAAVFTVVGVPAIHRFTVDAEVHWIPLVDSLNLTSLLNILLFVPLGFLLPSVWKECRTLTRTLLMGFGLSLCIEIVQLFNYRLTDVDDLITNTLGTVLGYGLYVLLSERLRLKLPPRDAKYEPYMLCLIVFAVMIAAQPFLSAALWNLVLAIPLWELIR